MKIQITIEIPDCKDYRDSDQEKPLPPLPPGVGTLADQLHTALLVGFREGDNLNLGVRTQAHGFLLVERPTPKGQTVEEFVAECQASMTKLATIKRLREQLGLGLMESKDLCERYWKR